MTLLRPGRESNSHPLDRKSNALTAASPRHLVSAEIIILIINNDLIAVINTALSCPVVYVEHDDLLFWWRRRCIVTMMQQTLVDWLGVVRQRHGRLRSSNHVTLQHDVVILCGVDVLRYLTVAPHRRRCNATHHIHCFCDKIIGPSLAVLLSRTWDSRTRTRTRKRTWILVLEDPRGHGLSSRTTTLAPSSGLSWLRISVYNGHDRSPHMSDHISSGSLTLVARVARSETSWTSVTDRQTEGRRHRLKTHLATTRGVG